MADRFYIETVGLDEMWKDFKKLATHGTRTRGLKRVDRLFYAAFAATQSKVHVETGRLQESGRADTHYLFDMWIGEIQYRRNPGIFELARGDTPTLTHPTGGHHFFNAVEPFIPWMEEAVNSIFDDYFARTPI